MNRSLSDKRGRSFQVMAMTMYVKANERHGAFGGKVMERDQS